MCCETVMAVLHVSRRRSYLAMAVVVVLLVLPSSQSPATATSAWLLGDAPALPAPEPTPDAARREAERILSGSPFGDEGGTQGDLPGQGGRGGDVRAPDPPSLPTAAPFAGLGAIGTTIMWIVVVAVVALAVFLLVKVVRNRARRSDDEGEDEDAAVVVADEIEGVDRTGDEWRRLALAAEAEGRWRDGLRCRYRALTAVLIERRVLADVAGRTTGEHRGEVHVGVPDAATDFHDAAELFDRAWYGNLPTGPDQRDRFVADEERIVATVERVGVWTPPEHDAGESSVGLLR